MQRLALVILSSLVLSACQSNNPYQAQSKPLADAPVNAKDHFDASAYPAKSADLSAYRNWQWAAPPVLSNNADISFAEAQNLTAAALDQRGLRPVQGGTAQLAVQVSIQTTKRTEYRDYYPDISYGAGRYSRHGRHGYSGVGVSVPLTNPTYTQEYINAQVSLRDLQTGQIVWQGQGESVAESNITKSVNKALKDALKNF
ncbi:DUF4136 domain-containing protein [Pseudomonas sp. F1_0610]|uniref:DUF4136 domain-containing protein n=1 Tax=Pseudomonas sp. F1_0610 TaxID=3114284 RepID=UPI0039C3D5AA